MAQLSCVCWVSTQRFCTPMRGEEGLPLSYRDSSASTSCGPCAQVLDLMRTVLPVVTALAVSDPSSPLPCKNCQQPSNTFSNNSNNIINTGAVAINCPAGYAGRNCQSNCWLRRMIVELSTKQCRTCYQVQGPGYVFDPATKACGECQQHSSHLQICIYNGRVSLLLRSVLHGFNLLCCLCLSLKLHTCL